MSSKAIATMLASMTKYFTKVKQGSVPLVFDAPINIAGSGTKRYDLKTLMTDYSKYNLLSVRVSVLLLNSEAASPTRGYYINSEATITIGVNAEGIVMLQNTSPNSANVVVRIDRPTQRV